jgi:polar amino acid transport system permease protein
VAVVAAPAPVTTAELPIRARPVPRPGRWVATVAVLVLIAMFVHGIITNKQYAWGIVGHYFLSPIILSGLQLTAVLTVVAMAIGIVIGILVAVMRLSTNRLLSTASWVYTWFFRGTPLLVQLFLWYYIGYLYPHLSFGIPFGPEFVSASANTVVSPLSAAIAGLGLFEGAYMAEIVRSGILSVASGQVEAARALGMTHRLLMRRIVLPQAMRVVIPPTGNQVITLLKSTSLVSVIALGDLLYQTEKVYAQNFETVPLLLVATLWYLILTTALSVGQSYLERYFGKGHVPLRARRAAKA